MSTIGYLYVICHCLMRSILWDGWSAFSANRLHSWKKKAKKAAEIISVCGDGQDWDLPMNLYLIFRQFLSFSLSLSCFYQGGGAGWGGRKINIYDRCTAIQFPNGVSPARVQIKWTVTSARLWYFTTSLPLLLPIHEFADIFHRKFWLLSQNKRRLPLSMM